MTESQEMHNLIEVYRSMPELWNTKLDVYKNKNVRRRSYEKLLEEFKKIKSDATLDELKKKLANMRTCYRRELKKNLQSQRSGAGADDLYVSNLWYFEEFDFLRDLELPLPAETTVTSDEDDDVSSRTQPSKVFKKASNARTEFLKKATEHLEASKKEQDDATIYSNGWACMFRKMSPEQQLYAKQAVDEIMLLGQLNKLCINYLHNGSSSSSLGMLHSSRTSTPLLSDDSQHFVSVPIGSPIDPVPQHFVSVPSCNQKDLKPQTIKITPQLQFVNGTEVHYTSVHDLLNDTQYQ